MNIIRNTQSDNLLLPTNQTPSRSGQAMVEYIIMAGMMIATVAILAVFMYTFRGYSGRILDLVASEYP